MKELPKKGLVVLFNAMLRISYWSKQLKTAEIILIPKPGKDPKELTSYPQSTKYLRSSYYGE
jgi:hypothetical protein